MRAKKEQWKSRGISDNGLKGRNFDNRRLPQTIHNPLPSHFINILCFNFNICGYSEVFPFYKVFILRKNATVKAKISRFKVCYLLYDLFIFIFNFFGHSEYIQIIYSKKSLRSILKKIHLPFLYPNFMRQKNKSIKIIISLYASERSK